MSELRECTNEIEDLLQDAQVFTSMFDPSRTASMAAYGTILNYDRLQQVFDDNAQLDWKSAVVVWKHDSYLSPVITMTYLAVERLLDGKRIY